MRKLKAALTIDRFVERAYTSGRYANTFTTRITRSPLTTVTDRANDPLIP
ncbi:MAG TPA: hypothetical protein VJ810_40365 [Blastocatellia bacterium]|nr:hypothetical protein [Blastocatellia bacterium]